MEEWNSKKRGIDAETKRMAKLAKYRFEKTRDMNNALGDSMIDPRLFSVGN